MPQFAYDTLIIGAGMAGLSAARALTASGQRVLVLEARNRVGGRIFTQHLHDQVLELGAEFVHGKPAELWSLIEESGLETYERDGRQFCFEDNKLGPCPEDESGDETSSLLDDLKHLEGLDLSFAEYLDRKQVPADHRPEIINFIEGYNAADHRLASAAALGHQQQAEEAIEGDRTFALRGGYSPLVNFLASRIPDTHGEICLNTPVHEIRWQPGQVEVLTSMGSFTASRAIITLPLGVLQANTVSITPAPGNILTLAGQLRMGNVRRLTLLFRERFWADRAADLSFLFAAGALPPVWWTQYPAAGNVLTGWVGGPRSTALANLSPEELTGKALATLARIFSVDESRLRSLLITCESHDWQADPYSLGAYSYVGTGGLDAPEQMTHPVADTLYFAGEHTDTTAQWGTVHAALRSGLRAASQILHP